MVNFYIQKNNDKRGFTLIELLVVIAIIALLASVVISSLSSARVKARNTKRSADIDQVIKALNLGISQTEDLPDLGNSWICISASCYEGWSGYTANATLDAYLLQNLKTKPTDPVGGRGYGGYLYNYGWTTVTGYNGVVFPAGHILHWVAELPVSSTVCAPGKVYSVSSTLVVCTAYIN